MNDHDLLIRIDERVEKTNKEIETLSSKTAFTNSEVILSSRIA